ncbi:MAG TPA: SGNH/GDSL hydrolase family protein [Terracidiphilus sp.]|jgi:lysophospholipase L1-like esterase|nr:SGNH/GDSL hydrolase family protein [Terracidiphilus sp.]
MKQARKFFAIAFLLVAALVSAQTRKHVAAPPEGWVATWGASQQIPEPQNALPPNDLRDATVRQIFHLSAGGPALRVHISNAFGTEPLYFTSVHVARPLSPSSPAIDPASDRPLTFAGAPDVTVPPGAEFVSDPLAYSVAALSDLAVTFHFDAPPARETSHPGSRATSYYVHGDLVSSPNLTGVATSDAAAGGANGNTIPGDCKPGTLKVDGSPRPCVAGQPRQVDHWYQVSEIDVDAAPGAAAIVALGDSITDGHGATTNGNDRWTDVLAARLQASSTTRNIGVSNQGIGGNHLLSDGLGPNVLARFDRDVLAPGAARWLIVFEGVNDLGGLARTSEVPPAEHADLVQRAIAAYQQIVARAHAHGLRVYGATITPYAGSAYYHPGPLSEADRQAVNQWIRAAGHFDAVIDFDAVVRDPQHPDQLLPGYDCGDHLHPSPAGYKAMGEAIPLSLFAR